MRGRRSSADAEGAWMNRQTLVDKGVAKPHKGRLFAAGSWEN